MKASKGKGPPHATASAKGAESKGSKLWMVDSKRASEICGHRFAGPTLCWSDPE